jgi:hypothetical protein
MKMPLDWDNKTAATIVRRGADWSLWATGGVTLDNVAAIAFSGDVVTNHPEPSTSDGALQTVWLSGGTPGKHVVRCTASFSDGQVIEQDFALVVTP